MYFLCGVKVGIIWEVGGDIMSYKIHLLKGDSSFTLTVKGVSSISQDENVYYLFDEEGEILFSSPLDKVIAIVKE